jgi:hypothetical protein
MRRTLSPTAPGDLTELRLLDMAWTLGDRTLPIEHALLRGATTKPEPALTLVAAGQGAAEASTDEQGRALASNRAPIVTPKPMRQSPQPQLQSLGVGGLQTASPCLSKWPLTCGFSITGGVKSARCPCGVRSFRVWLVSATNVFGSGPVRSS